MRLREMQYLLNQNLPHLQITQQQNGGLFTVSGLSAMRNSVEQIQGIVQLASYIEQVKASELFQSVEDKLTVSQDMYAKLANPLGSLNGQCFSLLQTLNQVLPKQNEAAIDIKLPRISTLLELSKTIDKLGLVFDKPLQHLFNQSVTFQGFDTGSAWIEIVPSVALAVAITTSQAKVIASEVMDFIGRLLKCIYDYRAQQKQLALLEQQIRSYKIANDYSETISKDVAEKQKLLVGELATSLINGLKEKNNSSEPLKATEFPHENHAIVINAIEVGSKLLQQGAEFHRALSTSEDIRKRIPAVVSDDKILPNAPLRLPGATEPSTQ